MTRRRIVLYNDSPHFGGQEVMSALVANELGSRHEVVYFHAMEELPGHLRPQVRSVRVPFSSSLGTLAILRNLNAREVRWLADRFAECRPDLALIVQGSVDLSLRGALAARRLGIPTVSYLPMAFPRREMGLRGGPLLDRYTALFYRLFDAFVTISASQRTFIHAFAGPDKPVFVLDNCIDARVTRPRPARGGGDRDLRIGVVGRLEWHQKGLGHLVEVARELKAARPDAVWVVVGDGPDRDRLERELTRRGLRERFEFRGWVKDRDEAYGAFDILFIPSLFEGVPMVLLEALARDVPVLARLAPGTQVFREYLPPPLLYGDTGAAVSKLASARTLLGQHRECAAEVRERALGKHSPERFASRVHEIVADLLDGGPGPRGAGWRPCG